MNQHVRSASGAPGLLGFLRSPDLDLDEVNFLAAVHSGAGFGGLVPAIRAPEQIGPKGPGAALPGANRINAAHAFPVSPF